MFIDINQLIYFAYYHFGLQYIYSYILFLFIILFNVSFCLNQSWQRFVNFASLCQKLILTLLNLLFLNFILLISFPIFIIFSFTFAQLFSLILTLSQGHLASSYLMFLFLLSLSFSSVQAFFFSDFLKKIFSPLLQHCFSLSIQMLWTCPLKNTKELM